jgi:hypothetical protein
MKRHISFSGLSIALSLLASLASCGYGGGGYGTPSAPGTWTVPDGSILPAAQVTSFGSGNLYYNVHSSAYVDGEIRGQIQTEKSIFSTSGTVSTLLTGGQETPAVATSASGIGSVSVEAGTNKISGIIVTRGIIGSAAHIHVGATGIPGAIIIPLSGGPTVWTVPDNTFLTAGQLTSFINGELYFNVHSTAYPDGEIRGQLNKRLSFASLNGGNEIPPVVTSASGTGVLALDPVTNQISGFIRTAGITGTQAHIHEGAVGANGLAIITLTESSPGSGVWNVPASVLTDAQETSFNAGGLYFNVHSAANPDGEIRGQIVPANLTVKTASLSGANEVPPVSTSATGSGILVLNSVTKEAAGMVSTVGITGTQAHIHDGAAGTDGPIIVPLSMISAGNPGNGGSPY